MIKKEETRGTLDLPSIRSLLASVAFFNPVFTTVKPVTSAAALKQGFSSLFAQTLRAPQA